MAHYGWLVDAPIGSGFLRGERTGLASVSTTVAPDRQQDFDDVRYFVDSCHGAFPFVVRRCYPPPATVPQPRPGRRHRRRHQHPFVLHGRSLQRVCWVGGGSERPVGQDGFGRRQRCACGSAPTRHRRRPAGPARCTRPHFNGAGQARKQNGIWHLPMCSMFIAQVTHRETAERHATRSGRPFVRNKHRPGAFDEASIRTSRIAKLGVPGWRNPKVLRYRWRRDPNTSNEIKAQGS